MTDFRPIPGQSVEGYDVLRRLGTDYYAVFADIPDADRAVWERAQGFVDGVGDRMREAWDRAEYPLDLAERLGELDLLNDGIEHPDLTRFSPLAAGLVNMEVSRGDGSLGTVIAVQGGLALRTLALFGSQPSRSLLMIPFVSLVSGAVMARKSASLKASCIPSIPTTLSQQGCSLQ